MNITRTTRLALIAVTLGALATGLVAAPAHADEVIAADQTAVTSVPVPGRISAPAITAAASLPGGIVVGNHAGQPVSLYAKGELTRTQAHPGRAAATFTGLTPGRVYTVVVGGTRVGSLTAVTRPTDATGLTVRTTDTPGTVTLTWQHRPTTATGGKAISYLVTATSPTAPTIRTTVTGGLTATISDLDRSAVYTFTVVPQNSAGSGKGTRAAMARPLGTVAPDAAAPTQTAPVAPTTAPAVTPTPAPAPAPGPSPAPQPSTRTIYVCPAGYPETAAGICQKALPYTYSSLAYTFHQEATGPAPLLDSYESTTGVCPGGYNLEDYGWVKYCRRYGAVPTRTVKDATPTGYTDDGSRWVTKDPTPAGYSDNGTEWVTVVAKEAVVVPA